MTIFDKKNKVIILVEGTVCNIVQINDIRNDYKKRKYLDLRLGLGKLYLDYKIKKTNIVFNFLGDFNTPLKRELSDFAHKKDVTKVLTNCQVVEFVGIDLPDGERMKTVLEEGYKYWGILELDSVLNEMKVKLKGE